MLAVRQRAACVTRRLGPAAIAPPQAARSYASDHGHGDHGDHHHAGPPQVEESPGLGLYIGLGAAGLSMFMYSVSRDEKSSLSKWIDSYRAESQKTWEDRNTLRADLKEQAARDRHLFSTSQKDQGYELRTPELIDSGSPNNVPAGHYVNLDKVIEHYQKQHLDEEARKAKKLGLAKTE
ncbi:NADH-ubiquinone oxidoreductase 17.8 kDa subunit [Diaporthe helianthi]|uniref:NADH-ubiquinone oxidoreductase 17.8 kDa subunit n=1 Tax=Diaporthe helianthi TaxID=158607 RepID=A0A2P5HYK6_DIAHE|nr:NADH-ubiquinone oxidoreductase 17.8 kDa subunit [Diaporthe helianthi]